MNATEVLRSIVDNFCCWEFMPKQEQALSEALLALEQKQRLVAWLEKEIEKTKKSIVDKKKGGKIRLEVLREVLGLIK